MTSGKDVDDLINVNRSAGCMLKKRLKKGGGERAPE